MPMPNLSPVVEAVGRAARSNSRFALGVGVGVCVMFAGYAVSAVNSGYALATPSSTLISQQTSIVADNIKQDAEDCAKGDKDGFRLREDSNLALLNWGFRFYENHALYQANVQLAHLKVWKGSTADVGLGLTQPVEVVIPRGRYNDLKPVMDVPKNIVAPIAQGQRIGTLRVMLDGKSILERPLVALTAVPAAGFFGRMWDDMWMWWEG